ncbi:MAG: dTDP-4-dehydrorhamnose 3,5-epimerase [Flavobacteriales bacterium]|nr:dTDP-4-dehydrorhamnose 3,5-epimerase [Flavobacteriales bacterium]
MIIEETGLAGLLIIRPKVFEDGRGYFFETYNKKAYNDAGLHLDVVQSNISKSDNGVVRGLHYQNPPHAQGKLVRVLRGRALDVALDIRKESPTFGRHFALELSEDNKVAIWVPPGFAHGFRTLEDNTLFFYDCTGTYHKAAEGNVLWNDPALAIDWGISDPVLSERDANAPLLADCNSLF